MKLYIVVRGVDAVLYIARKISLLSNHIGSLFSKLETDTGAKKEEY